MVADTAERKAKRVVPEPAAPVMEDTRPVIDLPRDSMSTDEAEGTEAMAPHPSERADVLVIGGEDFVRPRLGAMAMVAGQGIYKRLQRAGQKYEHLQKQQVAEARARADSGYNEALSEMLEWLDKILAQTVPAEVRWAIPDDEVLPLFSAVLSPFGGGGQ